MKSEDLLPKSSRRDPAPTRRLVAVIPPPVPLWCVYHDPENSGKDSELSVDPVLLLNVYEDRCPNRQGEPDTVTAEIFPVVLADGKIEEEDGLTVNFLGLSDSSLVDPEDWRDQIDWSLRRSKMRSGREIQGSK